MTGAEHPDRGQPEKTTQTWNGVSRLGTLNDDARRLRLELADRSKAYDWPGVIAILQQHEGLVNTARPGGRSLSARCIRQHTAERLLKSWTHC